MAGTNTGSLNGLPPTGRSMSLGRIDVIRVVAAGIVNVTGPGAVGITELIAPESECGALLETAV
jgi:hypothetical protein